MVIKSDTNLLRNRGIDTINDMPISRHRGSIIHRKNIKNTYMPGYLFFFCSISDIKKYIAYPSFSILGFCPDIIALFHSVVVQSILLQGKHSCLVDIVLALGCTAKFVLHIQHCLLSHISYSSNPYSILSSGVSNSMSISPSSPT